MKVKGMEGSAMRFEAALRKEMKRWYPELKDDGAATYMNLI